MSELDLGAVMARYSKALDAKPSKGQISADGIAALTDSVCDVPQLLAEIERLRQPGSISATVAQNATPAAVAELRATLDELQAQTVAYAARGRSSMPIKLADVVALMLVAEIVYAEAKGQIDG